jgi:hypothetical protein
VLRGLRVTRVHRLGGLIECDGLRLLNWGGQRDAVVALLGNVAQMFKSVNSVLYIVL